MEEWIKKKTVDSRQQKITNNQATDNGQLTTDTDRGQRTTDDGQHATNG